jgi:hypothetical protein
LDGREEEEKRKAGLSLHSTFKIQNSTLKKIPPAGNNTGRRAFVRRAVRPWLG